MLVFLGRIIVEREALAGVTSPRRPLCSSDARPPFDPR
jgi:hypothetical protein